MHVRTARGSAAPPQCVPQWERRRQPASAWAPHNRSRRCGWPGHNVCLGVQAAPAVLHVVDGLRVDWPDGFGLVRASNTTPVLVLRFEGQTEAALQRIQDQMLALLRTVLPQAQLQEAAH